MQVDAEDSIVYHVDKVRRPVAEDKALNKAVAWLKVRPHPACLAVDPCTRSSIS